MINELANLLKAKIGLFYLISYEEGRVEDTFEKICSQLDFGLYCWDLNKGFIEIRKDKYEASLSGMEEIIPEDALSNIQRYSGDAIFIMKDFHRFIDPERYPTAPQIIRTLRNFLKEFRMSTRNKCIVILAPSKSIPEDLEHDIYVVDFELPDYQTLRKKITEFIAHNRLEKKVKLESGSIEKMIKSLQGLTTIQAERAIAKVFVKYGKLHDYHISNLLSEKKQLLSKTGYLEYIDVKEDMNDIGGLKNLKGWLKQRELAFSEKAKKYGLPIPKGILLVGVQGVGKSLTAKAVAATWNLPLIRLDVGSVFGSLVGESEERIKQAIKISEAISPCIFWIDEIDKAFAGIKGEQGDSGTASRVFGSLLTWMQEKTKPVFIVATANNVVRIRQNDGSSKKKLSFETILPPELLRKGRFDELFFLDLPSEIERKEIFQIMVKKYNLDNEFDYDTLAQKSGGTISEKNDKGFGGAEIEQIVIEAMYKAFYDEERKVTTDDILYCMNQTKSLYELMQDEIDGLRAWADGRTRQASN